MAENIDIKKENLADASAVEPASSTVARVDSKYDRLMGEEGVRKLTGMYKNWFLDPRACRAACR